MNQKELAQALETTEYQIRKIAKEIGIKGQLSDEACNTIADYLQENPPKAKTGGLAVSPKAPLSANQTSDDSEGVVPIDHNFDQDDSRFDLMKNGKDLNAQLEYLRGVETATDAIFQQQAGEAEALTNYFVYRQAQASSEIFATVERIQKTRKEVSKLQKANSNLTQAQKKMLAKTRKHIAKVLG